MEKMNYRTVRTDWGVVRYADIGPEDGEVVLFSTGGGASFQSVRAFSWLIDSGFRVISVNRPGYFDLDVAAASSIEEHADIYHAVIHELNLEKIHVFGVSMGGLSALYYAKKYPVQSLLLWSAVSGPYVVNQDSAKSALGRLVLSDSGKSMISAMLKLSVRLFPKLTVMEFLRTEADLDTAGRRAIATQLTKKTVQKRELQVFVDSMTPMDELYTGMMDEVDKACALKSVDWSDISCPTLVIHSLIDKDVPPEHAQRLEKTLPDVRTRYVHAGGHFIWWGDEGKTVVEDSMKFLMKQRDD